MTTNDESPIPPLTDEERSALPTLVMACRILAHADQDSLTGGQISWRQAGQDRFLIKRSGFGFYEAGRDDMLPCPLRGRVDSPGLPPEYPMHQAIYADRKDVFSIVHTHGYWSTAFGATDLDIRAITHDGAYFVGRYSRFIDTSDAVVEYSEGSAVSRALGGGVAVLLRNHGGLVVGSSIEEATVAMLLLDAACKVQLQMEALQKPYHASSAADIERKHRFVLSEPNMRGYWDYASRLAKVRFPESFMH